MYRGSKKTVLVFKGKDSRIFDEAHFIVREGLSSVQDEDITREANRIISEYGSYAQNRKSANKKEKSSMFWYIWGLISGFFGFIISAVICNFVM